MRSTALLLALASLGASAPQKGVRTYRSEEALVKSNAPAAASQAVADRIERFCDSFAAFYGQLGLEPRNRNRIVARLFATREEFEEQYRRLYPDTPVPLAFFDPNLNALVLYDDQVGVTLRQTLFHECSHQYLNRFTYDAPRWLNEGLAEYFEGWRTTTDGELLEERPNLFGLVLVQEALASGKHLAPRDLVTMSDGEFYDFRRHRPGLNPFLHYATAWSFVYYALHGGHEEDRERFVSYLEELSKTRARFVVDDWEGLEIRWREFVSGLEAEPRDAEDHELLADGYRQSEDYERMAAHLRRSLALEPDRRSARHSLAAALYQLGRFEESRRLFEPLCGEGHAAACHWLGWMLLRGTEAVPPDYGEALAHARKAIDLAGGAVAAYFDLEARCHTAMGNGPKAVRSLRKALELVREQGDEHDVEYYAKRLADVR